MIIYVNLHHFWKLRLVNAIANNAAINIIILRSAGVSPISYGDGHGDKNIVSEDENSQRAEFLLSERLSHPLLVLYT